MSLNRFAKYAWFVLGLNILVVLWGAYVRATGSGAGCGQHWPLCNGEIVPLNPQVTTLVEFSHRLSSGLALVSVAVLVVWAFRAYPKGSPVRLGATLSALFIVSEALVGAGLVLFKLVAHDESAARAVSIAVHLINTFLLLGALTLTAWWGGGGGRLDLRRNKALTTALGLGLLGMMWIGASGAIVALGDTLFPPESLAAGLSQDLDPTAHFLVRLRLIHPIFAVLIGLGLIALAYYAEKQSSGVWVRRSANAVKLLVLAQWVAGLVNVALLAPVWMQLVHLLLADLTWVAIVLLSAAALAVPQRAETPVVERVPGGGALPAANK
ncbi:MAG: COX15/CtaA family protein [Anaerolineae bacterium]